MAAFGRGRDVAIQVKADIDKTSFARAQAAGQALGGREEFELKADVDTSSFARARTAQAGLFKESNKLTDILNRSKLSYGQLLTGIAAGSPIILDAAGALGALAGSLGAAAAGLGALGVGAGGAAGVGLAGIVSIAAPAISSLGDLKTAQDAYTEAVKRYGKNSAQAETALTKLRFEQERAGPAAVKFADNLRTLTSRWRELTRVGQTDFIGVLNDGVDRLNRKLPLLARSANRSVAALREGFGAFLDKATGPEFNHFVQVMTTTFAKSMKPLGDAFGNIALVLERLAVAVAPDLVKMARSFDDMTQGWVDSTRNAKNLRDVVHDLVGQTRAWWDLIKATGELLVAVLVPGMGEGEKAVKGITAQLKEWTAWVRSHPDEMRNFFKEALETTKQLAQALLSFLPSLLQISQAMRPIARAFLALLKGLNTLKVGNVSALTVLLGAIVGTKLIKGVAGITASFQALKVAALGAASAEVAATSVPIQGKGIAQAPFGAPMVATAPKGGMNIAAMAKYAKVAGGVAVAVTAVVGAFEALRTNFLGVRDVFTGFFNTVLRPLGDAFTDLVNTLSGGHAAGIFSAIGTALGTIAKPLEFVVKNLTKLVGLLAIGAIAAPFAAALAAIAAPIWLAIKGINLLAKGIKRLGDVVKNVVPFIRNHWGPVGNILTAPFRVTIDLVRKLGGAMREPIARAWDVIKDIFRSGAHRIMEVMGKLSKGIGVVIRPIKSVFQGLANVVRKVVSFVVKAVNKAVEALGDLKSKIPDLTPSLPGLPDIPIPSPNIPFLARGGSVPGRGIGDTVPAMLEPGEYVVNKRAVQRHRALIETINEKVPRFAKGGAVGGLKFALGPYDIPPIQYAADHAGGNSHVHITGTTTPWVVALGKKLQRLGFMVGEHPAFGGVQGQHSATGGHYDALAIDVNSAADETRAEVARIARLLGTGVAALAQQIKRIKIGGKGRLAEMAQGAADKMRGAANKYLAKIAPMEGAETAGIMGDGDVERIFARAAKRLSTSKVATLALGEAGYAESGMRDLAYGDSTSQGALQLLSSTAAGMNINPHDEGAIASAFLLRGFYGRGGANTLAASGLPAHLVAQSVQGSAFASGSNYAAQEAAARAWMKRFGLQLGGVIGPYLGAFHQGGQVPFDGYGLLQRGETVIPKLQGGGLVEPPDTRLGQLRRKREELREKLADVRKRDISQKEMKKLTEAITAQIAVTTELLRENRELRREVHTQNRDLRALRGAEVVAFRGLADFVGSQIGARSAEQRRNAAAGSTVSY